MMKTIEDIIRRKIEEIEKSDENEPFSISRPTAEVIMNKNTHSFGKKTMNRIKMFKEIETCFLKIEHFIEYQGKLTTSGFKILVSKMIEYILLVESQKHGMSLKYTVTDAKNSADNITNKLNETAKMIENAMLNPNFHLAVFQTISMNINDKYTKLDEQEKRLDDAIIFFNTVQKVFTIGRQESQITYCQNEINKVIGLIYKFATGKEPKDTGGKKNEFSQLRYNLNNLFYNEKWLQESNANPLKQQSNYQAWYKKNDNFFK